jgi:preprotein translocase subunit SecA
MGHWVSARKLKASCGYGLRAGLIKAFRVEEDMPMESGMLTRSLEGARKKLETHYYDIRKQVFEYDEGMNNQCKDVYTERRRGLKAQVIGYGQKGPLIEYKNEGYDMFLQTMTQMRRNVIYSMFIIQPRVETAQESVTSA